MTMRERVRRKGIQVLQPRSVPSLFQAYHFRVPTDFEGDFSVRVGYGGHSSQPNAAGTPDQPEKTGQK